MKSIAVIMDPIANITVKKDSTFALMLAAQAMDIAIYYIEAKDLFVNGDTTYAIRQRIRVMDDPIQWYHCSDAHVAPLHEGIDAVFMRKDPPFNTEYIYLTYMLELAEKKGLRVINKPQSLRDCNEKFFITHFPECVPTTLITSNMTQLDAFLNEQEEIVIKPLDGMGGASVFHVTKTDKNKHVIFETLTQHGSQLAMAQVFIPEIVNGDKRIIMINGEPIPYALARIPKPDDLRGNLAAGAKGKGVALTERDHFICKQVGPVLREKGLLWVGLDVIGDYLTEVNVTSPTCIRELDELYKLNIAGNLLAHLSQ